MVNYKDVLRNFSSQILDASSLGAGFEISGEFERIAVVGFGGSNLPARILETIMQDGMMPVRNVNNYTVPEYITKGTLALIVSYSGNTEETIEIYRRLVRRGATTIVITSGGKLEQLAPMYKSPLIKIPANFAPRQAIGYLFVPMLNILHSLGLISDPSDQIQALANVVGREVYEEYALSLVEKLHGRIPLIYSSDQLYSAAYRFKTQLNETANQPAFCNTIPESLHNELNAFDQSSDSFQVILLTDKTSDHPRVQARMDIFKKMLQARNIPVLEIAVKGDDLLIKIFSTMYLADWVSVLLAEKKGVDPNSIALIDEFKSRL